jgi:hypothetical protein
MVRPELAKGPRTAICNLVDRRTTPEAGLAVFRVEILACMNVLAPCTGGCDHGEG